MTLHFGQTPVPFTVLWSAEAPVHLAPCRFADGRPALCNPVAPGEGRPVFGKPHMQRQREAIANGLCDICARPLQNRTKVSLSHAHVRAGGEGPCVMQVEPLLHKECAAASLRYCPSLRRDIRSGTLFVRQVTRWRMQLARLTRAAVMEFTGQDVRHDVYGHAKVELIAWKDRDAAWLGAP